MTRTPADAAGAEFLSVAAAEFARYKRLGEDAMAQLTDEEFFYKPDDGSNSVYIIVNHLAGNMRSRWTNFLTTDGEKPDRNRDGEFADGTADRAAIMTTWESGWQCLFDALEPLGEVDLTATVQIRGEEHSVVRAIVRQLTHYAQHVGQILYIGKHLRGAGWRSLSIPKGKSAEYLGSRGLGDEPGGL